MGGSCSPVCGQLFIVFGGANGAGSTFLQACNLTVGPVTITEVTPTRIRGTFSGTGTCLAPGSSTPQAFTVTNGTFDVAIVGDIP